MVFLDLRSLEGRRLNQYAIIALNCSLNSFSSFMRHVSIRSHNNMLLMSKKKSVGTKLISHIIHNYLIK